MTQAVDPISPLVAEKLIQDVREILEKRQTFTSRLNLCMKAIVEGLGAEIGVLYLLNDDLQLEVCVNFDETGENFHRTGFKVGEGVVGYVAATGAPVYTPNIVSHPSFAYKPGIQNYTHLVFLGVPILLKSGVVGAIALQNPLSKTFEPWHQELLREVSQEIAKIPELKLLPSVPHLSSTEEDTQDLQGVGFCAGVGVGKAYFHKPMVWQEAIAAQDVKAESDRLKVAVREMIEDIDQKLSRPEILDDTVPREVMESYRMIAEDRAWVRRIQENVKRGLTAEAAVQKVRRETRQHYAQVGDSQLKARLSDLEDLAGRLLRHLTDESNFTDDILEPKILVAHHLGPAELLDYDRRFIKGLILEEGVHTAHVAIVARALDIPVIGRVTSALSLIKEGSVLSMDGTSGLITLNPTADQLAEAKALLQTQKQWQESAKELKDVPCQTQDGQEIDIKLNAGLVIDLEHMDLLNAGGIGLYRTEIPFMMRSSFPSIEVQTELYRDVIERAGKAPITFRTLDVGGDKVVPYLWQSEDENPAMGWRAIRVAMDRPALLRQQARALICASEGRVLRVLFPMVTVAEEYLRAKKLVEQEITRATKNEEPIPTKVEYGVMLEVPSMVWELDHVLPHLDFVSVGTNDLFQFFYACDRTNPRMAHRYESLSSSFIKFLSLVQEKCAQAKVPVSICGEMASHPLEAMALLGLGFTHFSLTPPSFIAVKKMVISVELAKLKQEMRGWLDEGDENLRDPLLDFANKEGVLI